MTNTTIPTYHKGKRNFGTGYDMMARIAELEAEVADLSEAPQNTMGKPEFVMKVAERFKARAQFAEAALDEIIMEATSRNHAIDIARRARAEGGE